MTLDILMIDDQDESTLRPLIKWINNEGYNCDLYDFNSMEEKLKDDKYQIIILDFFEGGDNPGLLWFNYIWENRFFPVIFHSANAEGLISNLSNFGYNTHPLVNVVPKGLNSYKKIIELIKYSEKLINQFNSYDEKFQENFSKIQQETKKYTLQFLTKDLLSNEPHKYDSIFNRRLANFLEKQNQDILEPFEMYIYPPVGESLLVGDILEESENNEYYIVLTPSCDLVERKGVTSKVHVAHLESTKKIYSKIGYDMNSKNIIENLISKILNSGYLNEIVPLPPLINAYKTNMLANLKKCDYIDRKKIAFSREVVSETQNYVRIASIDSPFAEMIVWAYMTVSCRPGLPDRNVELWANSIQNENKKEAT